MELTQKNWRKILRQSFIIFILGQWVGRHGNTSGQKCHCQGRSRAAKRNVESGPSIGWDVVDLDRAEGRRLPVSADHNDPAFKDCSGKVRSRRCHVGNFFPPLLLEWESLAACQTAWTVESSKAKKCSPGICEKLQSWPSGLQVVKEIPFVEGDIILLYRRQDLQA